MKGKRRVLRESGEDDEVIFTSFNGATEPVMAFDLGLNNLPDTEVAEHEGDTGSLRDENDIFSKTTKKLYSLYPSKDQLLPESHLRLMSV